jgi:uncharacterized protein YqfA (UPF0365 family)
MPGVAATRRSLEREPRGAFLQAKAEERRAMAVALEQEMRARVVEAKAEVPRAMAEAFRQGNMGIMDYSRMKNVQADTVMRESIADAPEEPPGTQRK